MQKLEHHIHALESMRRYPDPLYFLGNPALLQKPKIAIVGSRKPTPYTRAMTHELAQQLSRAGICIVSGAALGVDAIAHGAAGPANTIAVVASGIDIRYPRHNRTLIESIEHEGLVLSQFEPGFKPTPWSFVVRNELVVALGDVLVVTQADLNSGTMRSVEFARKMGKKIFVLVQRIGESEGSNALAASGEAEVIYDIAAFAARFETQGNTTPRPQDDLLDFCAVNPSYDDAAGRFGARLFEYELDGKIRVENGKVYVV